MTIAFRCACGKAYQLADSAAGRKAKCTGCSAILLVPQPAAEPEFHIVVEDDPPARPKAAKESEFEVVEDDPPAKPKPAAKGWDKKPPPRRAVADDDDDDEPAPPRKKKRRKSKASGGVQWKTVGSGILTMIIAVVWFFGGLMFGVLFYFPPILFVLALIGTIAGLFGFSGDDDA